MNRQLTKKSAVELVTDRNNPHVKYLILPTVKKMRRVGVSILSIEIRNGKVAFYMEPEETEDNPTSR